MRIIMLEMRKIWNVKRLAAIALICLLFYTLFMDFYIDNYQNENLGPEYLAFTKLMVQKYGATLDEEELADFIKIREGFIAEAEQYIDNDPRFAQLGIFSYKDYQSFKNGKRLDEDAIKVMLTLNDHECGYVEGKIDAMGIILNYYTNSTVVIAWQMNGPQNSANYQRYAQIRDSGEYLNIMDDGTLYNTRKYFLSLTMLSILSTLILVSPLIVTDRSRRTNVLQYSSRLGRRILTKQMFAVVASSIMMTTVLLGVFGYIYSGLGTQVFWNQGLTSFLNWNFMPIPITFGQFVILMVLFMYLLSVGAAFISFLLSRFSQNTIAIIIKLLPVLVVLIFLSNIVMDKLLTFGLLGTWFEPGIVVFELLFGLAASLFVLRREKRVDVL